MAKLLDFMPGTYTMQSKVSHKPEYYTMSVDAEHNVTVRVHVEREMPNDTKNIQYRKLNEDGIVYRRVVNRMRIMRAHNPNGYIFEPLNELPLVRPKKKLAFKRPAEKAEEYVTIELNSSDVVDAAEQMVHALRGAWDFICKHDTTNPYLTEPGKSVRSVLDKLERR